MRSTHGMVKCKRTTRNESAIWRVKIGTDKYRTKHSNANKDHVAYSSTLEADDTNRPHSLPHIERSLYKHSFVNRCLCNMI